MDRRKFLVNTASSFAAITSFPTLISSSPKVDPMDRIGLTTVVFRDRFASTAPQDILLKDELSLLEVPEYFADRFGIHIVEFWAKHFESTTSAYLTTLKKSLLKSKCRLINIQAESNYDLSDPNETNRLKGVEEMKTWMDIGETLNSQFIRVSAMNKSYQKSVDSLRTLSKYAKKKRVTALVENHYDLFSNPVHHLNIVNDVQSEYLALLADFGNYPQTTSRYDALQKIAPFTRLISAKTSSFNEKLQHTSYDFGECIKIFEGQGYQGIYSLEQWGPAGSLYNEEKIIDWMINEVKKVLI